MERKPELSSKVLRSLPAPALLLRVSTAPARRWPGTESAALHAPPRRQRRRPVRRHDGDAVGRRRDGAGARCPRHLGPAAARQLTPPMAPASSNMRRFLKDLSRLAAEPDASAARPKKPIDDMSLRPIVLPFSSSSRRCRRSPSCGWPKRCCSVGRGAEARDMARDAWDSAGLDAVAETQLLSQFEKDLRPEDQHRPRRPPALERPDHGRRAAAAARSTSTTGCGAGAPGRSRANAPDAPTASPVCPTSCAMIPGLSLDRAHWLQRSGNLSGAEALLAGTPPSSAGSAIDPEYWLKTAAGFRPHGVARRRP